MGTPGRKSYDLTEQDKLMSQPLAIIEAKWPRLFMALTHHRTTKGERLTFADKKWLETIYKDNNPRMVIIKCSQVHMTEHFICAMFTLAKQGLRGLYILPTNEHRRPFVQDRIDRLRDCSEQYQRALATNKLAHVVDSNVYKSIFSSGWKFVGANVRKNFFEFPADVLIMDEYDLLDQDNIVYAKDRIADSKIPHVFKFGNPTTDGIGISKAFQNSTQNEWFVRCCHCGEEQVLDWYTHFVEQVGSFYQLRNNDGHPICLKCGKPFDRLGPGRWHPHNSDSEISGYRISRLFVHKSDTDIIGNLDSLFPKFLESQGNETLMQNFHNNYLGQSYESYELRLTESVMRSCAAREPLRFEQNEHFRTIAGIDQGRKFTVVISAVVDGIIHDVAYEICDTWEQVYALLGTHNTTTVVVDAQGGGYAETRNFVRRQQGAWMCYYRPKDQVKKAYDLDYEQLVVSTNRTELLDSMVAAFKNKRIVIRHDWQSSVNGSYLSEMQVPKRIMDAGGNIVWTKGTDHFFHASAYRHLALLISGLRNSAVIKREAHVDMMKTGKINVQTIIERGHIGDPDNGNGHKSEQPEIKKRRSAYVG
jgi:hypothetical protein